MANYPGSASTDANLFQAVNNLSTTLSDNPLTSGATTVNVASTTGFPTTGYITIDAEAISYTGTTSTSFTGCTRGADGTTAASHTTGTQVFHDVVAAHHNVLKDEIKAIETDLLTTNPPLRLAGGTMTGQLQAIDGSATTPSLTFTTQNNMGLYRFGTDTLGITVGGVNRVQVATTAIIFSKPLQMGSNKITSLANGTASTDAATFGQIYYGFQAPVQATSATFSSVTSSTFTNTNLTASITPTSATHRIKVTISGDFENDSLATTNAYLTIARGATNLASTNGFTTWGNSSVISGQANVPVSVCYIDSPATTSAVTYTVQIRSSNNSSAVKFPSASTAVMVLEEIV